MRGRRALKRAMSQRGMTLVELLVVMVIMTVVSTMIILTWFSLQNSYSFTVTSTNQRVAARDAMSRMVRELRDAQGGLNTTPIGSASSATSVVFWTPFNNPGSSNLGVNRPTSFTYDEGARTITRTAGGSTTVLIANIVNHTAPVSPADPPVFSYDYYDSGGHLVSNALSVPDPASIIAVHVHVLVDLNPGKSPTFMNLESTAQLRNLSQG
jgi:prepilin-type N-terminal cleavage/methylation domain-containing protein